MPRRRLVRSLVVLPVLAVLATTACGSASVDSPAASGSSTSSGAAFPVTVEHAFGSTTVEAEPSRVVALSGEEDVMALLDLVPVAISEGLGSPGEANPWVAGTPGLDEAVVLPLTTNGVDLEQIAVLAPDLVLATNLYGLDQQTYDQLSEIAPTVAYPGEDAGLTRWQDLSTLVGAALGRSEDVEAAVAETEAGIEELAAELPGLDGATFTSSYYYEAGMFATIDDTSTGAAALLSDLGMVLSPTVLAEVSERTVSLEQVRLLDADVVSMGFADDALRAALEADPLYQGLQAVQDDRVLVADVDLAVAGNNPTILNVPWQLEQFRPVLERAAA